MTPPSRSIREWWVLHPKVRLRFFIAKELLHMAVALCVVVLCVYLLFFA